jgi:UDP-GlcNAc:undecaprenyl-phosphate/decaprenyl-phosphate GlcNAc-1-phosphate transferase
MREYLVTVLLSAIICYLITPLVRDLAIKSGAVMQIRSRDVHDKPTPRWGGLAMWLSMALTLVIVNQLPLVAKSFSREATGIFLAGTFILFLGLIDDRFDLDPITKFAGQALAGGILLIYGVQILWLPINGITTVPVNIGQILTVLFVMVVINAINFVDGLDGLATGIVAICAASFFAFSYLLAVINGFSRAGAPSLITAIVIGLCLGFLPHNFYPAQIFMGDSGAMFLGLLISASAITLTGQVDASAITNENSGTVLLPLLLPFTVLAIPLLDFVMAIIRRIRAGRSPFSADREHLHHRIMRMGLTQQRTTVVLYLWTAMFAIPTASAAFIPIPIALLAGLLIFALSVIVIKQNKNKVIIEHNRDSLGRADDKKVKRVRK